MGVCPLYEIVSDIIIEWRLTGAISPYKAPNINGIWNYHQKSLERTLVLRRRRSTSSWKRLRSWRDMKAAKCSRTYCMHPHRITASLTGSSKRIGTES